MANLTPLKKLAMPVALALTSFLGYAQSSDLAPTILHPDPQNGALLYGLSDNGDWGVSCVAPGYVGFYDFAGAHIYDLRSNPVKDTDLAKGHTFASAFDVTDDGTLVAGSIDQKPAVCRLENGKWVWHTLPVSNRVVTVENPFTGYSRTYTYDGGEVSSITPDGRYAVGNCRSNEYGQLEHSYMWDLQDLDNIVVIDVPVAMDREDPLEGGRLIQISADGRYVRGRDRVWDRQTGSITYIPVELDIYAQGMSNSGKYYSGVVDVRDTPFAATWEMETDYLKVYDKDIYADAVAWAITDDGLPFVARPYITPYADAYVFHNDFLYSFKELYEQVYGMNLMRNGIDNTGKPFKVSADGRTVVFITAIQNCYVARFKEDIRDALDRIDLFKTWSASPASGSSLTRMSSVKLSFQHPVEVTDPANAFMQIELRDADGNFVANPLQNGGVTLSSSTQVTINFRSRALDEGKKYTLHIPAGTFSISGLEGKPSPEINLVYNGRGDHPVKAVSVSPADGSTLASLSLSDNPVVVRYDTNIQMAASSTTAPIYIDEDEQPVAWANMDVDLNSGRDLVIFPNNTLPLYKGSTYRIVIPEGSVVDMSGYGGCEEFVITYVGSYIPQLGDEQYLFDSDCNNYDNFLFYEGDHGEPTDEYAAMFFTADNTPWAVVMEDENSTDMSFGSHSCYKDGRQSDDWVTTRQILIPEDTETYLSFDSQSYRKSRQDRLKVYVYENATILNNLTKATIDDIRAKGDLVYDELQSPGATEAGLSGEWTHNVIDLTEYAGKPIYICFLNDNQNQSMVIIDNIQVVKNVKAFITIRSKENVVNESEASVWGILSATDETVDYTGVQMTLKDAEGNPVSSISQSGISLKAGESFDFTFPEALPLEYGVVNPYTIEFTLEAGEEKAPVMTYEGVVRNLTFEPVKRVVIEEFTGRDCQFCPGGILTMEHLMELYGDRVVPVAIHCYNGADPKGMNVIDYWQFTGMNAAPQARVNRGPISGPLYQTSTGYVNSGAAYGEMLWKDYVQQELAETALMEVEIERQDQRGATLPCVARIKSALSMDDVRIRVFAVLLEDRLIDYQANAYYTQNDPILGEFGEGGIYGKSLVYLMFDNVARGTWGTSFNGTAGLVPSTVVAGEEYEVEIDMQIPAIVENIDNCKVAVMLIDESTGRIINARMSSLVNGVDGSLVEAPEEQPAVYYNLQGIPVANPTHGIYIVNGKKVLIP